MVQQLSTLPTLPRWAMGILPVVILTCGAFGRQAWGLGTETHGNAAMSLSTFAELNPVANHRSRVYAYWVNGHEGLFYRGDTKALNEVLAAFAAVPLEEHVLVLRPGPQSTKDFDGNSVDYDWNLDIVGGIAGHQTSLDKGDRFWPKFPVLTVCIDGERLKLADLTIPESVILRDTDDLRQRYLEGLDSTDTSVRGWGTGILSRLNTYREDDARIVASMLRDTDEWVRLNAAAAIANYGATAKPLLPNLLVYHDLETSDRVKARLTESLDKIQEAEADAQRVERHQSLLQEINDFCRKRARTTDD